MKGKAVLAFSGGLDTSVVIKYLQDKHGLDVVTVTVDVGQEDNLKKISAKAKSLGVLRHYNIDARQEFVDRFIFPAIRANALYQKKYCLATALARPLIAQKIVEVAKKEGASALAHGCTGKGNDQVRFDVTYRSGSNLPIIAPIRDLNLTRDVELKYAKKHNIPIDTTAKKFSIDQNLWEEQLREEIWKMHSLNPLMMHSSGLRQRICPIDHNIWKLNLKVEYLLKLIENE